MMAKARAQEGVSGLGPQSDLRASRTHIQPRAMLEGLARAQI